MLIGASCTRMVLRTALGKSWGVLLPQRTSKRAFSKPAAPRQLDAQEIDELLSKPTWSVKALLPTDEQIESNTEVTAEQVRHLLRLSALPPPETPEQEAKILRDLRAQLHFVKEIQSVDTSGVKPLSSIRDETAAGEREDEINMDTLKDALEQELIIGKHHKRIRRRRDVLHDAKNAEEWDVLGQAPKKVGKFFVVESADRGDS